MEVTRDEIWQIVEMNMLGYIRGCHAAIANGDVRLARSLAISAGKMAFYLYPQLRQE